MDNIEYGSTSEAKSKKFVNHIQSEFEMNMIGKLNYFLDLQVKRVNVGIFISQAKYPKNLVKTFGLENTKRVRTLIATSLKFCRDEQGEDVDLAYIGA